MVLGIFDIEGASLLENPSLKTTIEGEPRINTLSSIACFRLCAYAYDQEWVTTQLQFIYSSIQMPGKQGSWPDFSSSWS